MKDFQKLILINNIKDFILEMENISAENVGVIC